MVDAVELEAKKARLKQILLTKESWAIAFSGGVDSSLLLAVAKETLPAERLWALTAKGAIFPLWETEEAKSLVSQLGVNHLLIDFDVLTVPSVVSNPPDRCYYCKKTIFQILQKQTHKLGLVALADGSNLDDDSDWRPGTRAKDELGVVSPLKEAGLTKDDIRKLSFAYGLKTWQKPSYACLASRFPYGNELTLAKLKRVEEAEDYLHSLGFQEVRVRYHEGELARLELGPAEQERFLQAELFAQVDSHLKALGFVYVSLDLGGYRQGSLNVGLV